tara:strand:+ start:200 stop:457 length:258 start_codon:yes stop_codon:yes gene_type:complete
MSNSRRNNTLEFSHQGGVVVNDTTATTGNFGAIQVVNDAVFSAITLPEYTNASDLQTITLVAGTVIYGTCTAFTLTSGVVIAHAY